MKYKLFYWDYHDLAPLKEIVEFTKANPKVKLFNYLNDFDTNHYVILAENKQDAKLAVIQHNIVIGLEDEDTGLPLEPEPNEITKYQ
jgi:hypothetical protein